MNSVKQYVSENFNIKSRCGEGQGQIQSICEVLDGYHRATFPDGWKEDRHKAFQRYRSEKDQE